ncbi:recombinase family protein [Streptomyces kroppenstedtii]|uniref:recombinase family protein n=1 Tax=Streptomyces kroppenstedtii TaxID=3051181 RepID=UPI0028D0512B|nr:recombinase family protein [Streptomyces sp. DSM 40484]
MQPAMYGYMRLTASGDAEDESVTIRHELATHAQREGFTLERVFIERVRVDEEPAFFTLIDALKTTEVKHVIVPSLWHFARLPGLQAAMRDHIEQVIGARLWVVQGVRVR